MKVSIVTFSVKGAKLGNKIKNILEEMQYEVVAVTTNSRAADILSLIDKPLDIWVESKFNDSEILIFVGACGIAVRKIAPYVKDKKTDPAVLVVDDCGKNIISLLSGHLGGGNFQAELIGNKIGANPVITTSSDCNGKIAIDMFAKKNNLAITSFTKAKEVQSALLDGENVYIESALEIEGNVPQEMTVKRTGTDGLYNSEKICNNNNPWKIRIGLHNYEADNKTLWLIPRCVVAGIGCKKGKSKEEIVDAINYCFGKLNIPVSALNKITSIDLKENETGLVNAAEFLKVETQFFSSSELKAVEGNFKKSEFVESITGVDNVCERAAKLGSDYGKILLCKTKIDGITVALAMEERSISFE